MLMHVKDSNEKFKKLMDFEDEVIATMTQFRKNAKETMKKKKVASSDDSEEEDEKGDMDDELESMSQHSKSTIGSHKSPGVFGVNNIGNTCFFNSTMQALNATRELVEYYIDEKNLEDFEKYDSILNTGTLPLIRNQEPQQILWSISSRRKC